MNENKIVKFWQELKRRKVVRVTIIYASTAFILLQLIDLLVKPLHLPEWVMTFFVVLLLVGFPIVVILAWIFDITPEGLQKTEKIDLSQPPVTSSKKKILILDFVILILLITVGVLAYPRIFSQNKQLLPQPSDEISIAILPFENLTGDTSLDFWQQGISEYLLNSLATSEEIKVVSSHVIAEVIDEFKEQTSAILASKKSQEIAKILNAGIYITGNFLGNSSQKSVMINLSNTNTGEVIWSDKVDGDLMNNYGKLLQEISASVRNFLELKYLKNKVPVEFADAYPNSAEAYKYFIEGLDNILLCNFKDAIDPLLKSTEIDPDFTFASFYLAWAYYYGRQYDEANQWILQTYEKKQNLPLQYQPWINLWYACFISENKSEIYKSLSQLEKSTSKSRFLWYDIGATYWTILNEYQKGIEAFEKVDKISEELGETWNFDDFYDNYSRLLLAVDRPQDAIKVAERGMALNQNSQAAFPYYFAYVMLKDSAKINEALDLIESIAEKNLWTESDKERYKYFIFWNGRDTLTAEIHARKSYELDPTNKAKMFSMAVVFIDGKINIEEGLKLVDKLLETNPDNISYLKLKGTALFKLGNYTEALNVFNIANEKRKSYDPHVESEIFEVEKAIEKEKQQID